MICAPTARQLVRRQALDRGLRADGHEHRRLERGVRQLEAPSASVAIGGEEV